MKRFTRFFLFGFSAVFIAGTGAMIFPNPAREYLISSAKADGYVKYTPAEAYTLAKKICSQCHSEERIKKYCERCGPPFVVVVPHMQLFIANYRLTRPHLKVTGITQYQAVAIVQVWNAIVGNWEGDFQEKDMLKIIGENEMLISLYKTPVKDRPIESALMNRNDLKIGYMAEMEKNRRDSAGDRRETNSAPGRHDHTAHEHKP